MPVGYKPIETSGQVVNQQVAKGTKSARQAIVLVTNDGTYDLRRRGGNPFSDPELKKLVGKTIRCKGILMEQTLTISSWDVQ